MHKLILTICLSFLTNLLFSQENNPIDSLKDSKTNVVKDSRIDKLDKSYVSTYKLIGYRIQIYSGNKKQPAREARQIFTNRYHETKAHESYEQPYFKVKVGDFKTKLEALKFKTELVKYFPNCFIVKDEIDYKISD
jgi:hypothetical protein